MKYNKPEDVVLALEAGKVKELSLKQYISKLRGYNEMDKVSILEAGLAMWKGNNELALCTYYNKPIDQLTIVEILSMYDKDKRLLTINHCKRFTILMTLDSFISISKYTGVIIHPRDIYLE